MNDTWWSLPLTLGIFLFARKLAARCKTPLLNPLLISIAMLVPLLLLIDIPYQRYLQGSLLINNLLQPAVVALAYPLYEQMHQIRAHWKSIIAVCFIGSLSGIISGTAIALWMGATKQIAATVLPKSATTPIAIAVSTDLGGIPALSAICVMMAGLLGAIFGHQILDLLKIKNKLARGLAIGNDSHALGTARCAELDHQEGAFSSLALVLCGLIASLLAPLLFPFLIKLS